MADLVTVELRGRTATVPLGSYWDLATREPSAPQLREAVARLDALLQLDMAPAARVELQDVIGLIKTT